MITTIKYKGYYDDVLITEQEALQVGKYRKVIEINNSIKRIDEYEDGVLDWVIYFKAPEETDKQILKQIRPLQPRSECYSINTVEPYGAYKAIYEKRYTNDDNDVPGEFRELLDPQGYVICSERIFDGKSLDKRLVHKNFHNKEIYNTRCGGIEEGSEDPHFRVFKAKYSLDGTLDYIVFNIHSTYDSEHYSIKDYDELVRTCKLTPQLAKYYLTADFFPA